MFKLNKKDKIGIPIFLIFIIICLIINLKRDKKLLNEGKFTIATIDDIYAMKGGMTCKYTYSYNSITYTQNNYIGRSKPKESEKYFVTFLPDDPEVSTIFLEIKVPDSIYNKDEIFWSKIPIKYNQKDFDIEFE